MKNSILITLAVFVFTQAAMAKPADEWRVKTTERQFSEIKSVSDKTATSNLSVMSKEHITSTDTGVSVKKAGNKSITTYSRTLSARPEVNTLEQSFWLYDAHVVLNSDADGDGFFNYFTLEFDADTEFNHAQVYARLYLARGETFKEFHVTSDFNIYSDRNDDVFVVESELLTGFPTADYEVLIELYDAYNDQLVATLDGLNDADLYIVPLESEDYEEVYVDQVVVIHESGGSIGWLALLLVPVFAFRFYATRVCI